MSLGNAENYRNSALKGAKKLEETLKSFGVDAKVVNVSVDLRLPATSFSPVPG